MKKPKAEEKPQGVRSAIRSLLTQEIHWHRKNKGGSGCSPAFESGFIVGLQQARALVGKALREML
jgi:hypothetical protein